VGKVLKDRRQGREDLRDHKGKQDRKVTQDRPVLKDYRGRLDLLVRVQLALCVQTVRRRAARWNAVKRRSLLLRGAARQEIQLCFRPSDPLHAVDEARQIIHSLGFA
jgi:hypothetical protein